MENASDGIRVPAAAAWGMALRSEDASDLPQGEAGSAEFEGSPDGDLLSRIAVQPITDDAPAVGGSRAELLASGTLNRKSGAGAGTNDRTFVLGNRVADPPQEDRLGCVAVACAVRGDELHAPSLDEPLELDGDDHITCEAVAFGREETGFDLSNTYVHVSIRAPGSHGRVRAYHSRVRSETAHSSASARVEDQLVFCASGLLVVPCPA